MTGQRQYEPWTVFNARCVDLRHLWEPSREYNGKPQEKPSWFSGFIVPKTVADWRFEPALAGIAEACRKLWQNNQHVNQWPVSDGDLPNKKGQKSEWAAGHWVFGASTSSSPPNVELVQQGGALTKLAGRAGVKPGDYVMVGGTCAIAQNDPGRVKSFLNAIVFTAPGQEIAFANSVSGSDLMAAAAAQGMQVTGFGPAPNSFGAPPAQQQGGWGAPPQPQGQPGGFGAPPANQWAPSVPLAQPQGQPGGWGAPPVGFSPPPGATGQPGFAPQTGQAGFAPTQAAPATGYPSNPAPGAQWGAPQPQPSAGAPGAWGTPPQAGWPQR